MPGTLAKDVTYDASQVRARAFACPRGDYTRWRAAMTRPGAGFSLSEGWEHSGLTLNELWLRYTALGGTANAARVAAYTRGRLRPDPHQHNMIAQAINEYLIDRGENHPVGYQDIPVLP